MTRVLWPKALVFGLTGVLVGCWTWLDWGCTARNAAYCQANQDCQNPDFPFCDLTIAGCVGDRLVNDGSDASGGDGGQTQDQNGADGSDQDNTSDGSPVETLYVDARACPGPGTGTASNPFCAIDDAVVKAQPGALIVVRPGTYPGDSLQITADLSLQGQTGAQIVTNQCPGILIAGNVNVNMTGFLITGNGGIRATGGSSAYLAENVVQSTDCVGIECLASNCQIIKNRLFSNSKGGILVNGGNFQIINNFIARNGAGGPEGGVKIQSPGDVKDFINNTVVLNFNFGVRCESDTTLWNSIFCDNSTIDVLGSCLVNNSDVCENDPPVSGAANISDDPVFVGEEENDFCITANSPCVDKGSPAVAPADDIDGRPRDAIPDMGACEAG